MGPLIPNVKPQFFDVNGDPLVGGKLYTYVAGTTTPLATYSEYTLTTPNTNPIILDSRGECDIWHADNTYKYVLKDSDDVTIWTKDNVVIEDISTLSASLVFASQAEAEAGTNETKYMNPLRTAQAIAQLSPPPVIATQAEAEAGTENTATMTPLRTQQHFDATYPNSYIGALTTTSNMVGNNSVAANYYLRDGLLKCYGKISFTGFTSSGNGTITLPSGYVIDAAKGLLSSGSVVGLWNFYDSSGGNSPALGYVVYKTTTTVQLKLVKADFTYLYESAVGTSAPGITASGDFWAFNFEVPLV